MIDLVRDLTERAKKCESKGALTDASKWYAKALQYNVPRGKRNRGLATIFAFKTLARADELTPENLKRAQYLGWCVEMVCLFTFNFQFSVYFYQTRRQQYNI